MMPSGNLYDSFIDFYLRESPQLIGDIDFIYNDEVLNIEQAKELINNHPDEIIDAFEYNNIKCPVYSYKKNDNNLFYALVHESHPSILGVVKYRIHEGMMITSGLWNAVLFKGLIFAFFTQYLTSKHNIIVSDGVTTKHGMSFWNKFSSWALDNRKEIGIFRIAENKLYPMDSVNELQKFFNSDIESNNYRVYVKNRKDI